MQNEINNWQNATILENAGNPIESENILLREQNSIQLISHSNMGVDSMNFEMLNTDFTTSTPHEMITDDVLDGLLQDNLVMDSSSFHQQPQQLSLEQQQSNPLKRSFGQTISPSFHSYSSSSSTTSASYFPPTKKFAAAAPIATINIVGTKTLDGFSNADAYEACVGTCPTDAVSSGAISIPPTPQFIVKVPNLPSLSQQQPQQKPIPMPSSIIPNISAIPFSPANSNETSPMMSPILFQQIQGQMQQQIQQAQQQGAAAPRKFTITLNVLTVQKSNDPADAAKPWKCDSPGCTKSFSDRSNLIQHLRTHTEEKPYVCDKCDKCFSHSASLKEHQRIHSSEKPFVCETCQKTFTQQSNFRRHLRIHSGEKPYHCNNCGKDFNQSSNLKQHLILKHGSLANESNTDSS